METTLMGDLGRTEKKVETTIMGYLRDGNYYFIDGYIFGL